MKKSKTFISIPYISYFLAARRHKFKLIVEISKICSDSLMKILISYLLRCSWSYSDKKLVRKIKESILQFHATYIRPNKPWFCCLQLFECGRIPPLEPPQSLCMSMTKKIPNCQCRQCVSCKFSYIVYYDNNSILLL